MSQTELICIISILEQETTAVELNTSELEQYTPVQKKFLSLLLD